MVVLIGFEKKTVEMRIFLAWLGLVDFVGDGGGDDDDGSVHRIHLKTDI